MNQNLVEPFEKHLRLKKWICFSVCKTTIAQNNFPKQAKFTIIILLWVHLNIDVNIRSPDNGKLEELSFNLPNWKKLDKCFTETHSSKIDRILTNIPNSFQKSGITKATLSDFQKFKSTFFKSLFYRLQLVHTQKRFTTEF